MSDAPPRTPSIEVLPRERCDIPDEIRRIPPPPTPELNAPFGMRVARVADAGMVAEWMNRPHLASAWEYDWPTPRWVQHLSAQLEGSYSLPLLGSMHGIERAYLELYWGAKDLISYHYDAEPYDLVGVIAPSVIRPVLNERIAGAKDELGSIVVDDGRLSMHHVDDVETVVPLHRTRLLTGHELRH